MHFICVLIVLQILQNITKNLSLNLLSHSAIINMGALLNHKRLLCLFQVYLKLDFLYYLVYFLQTWNENMFCCDHILVCI